MDDNQSPHFPRKSEREDQPSYKTENMKDDVRQINPKRQKSHDNDYGTRKLSMRELVILGTPIEEMSDRQFNVLCDMMYEQYGCSRAVIPLINRRREALESKMKSDQSSDEPEP